MHACFFSSTLIEFPKILRLKLKELGTPQTRVTIRHIAQSQSGSDPETALVSMTILYDEQDVLDVTLPT